MGELYTLHPLYCLYATDLPHNYVLDVVLSLLDNTYPKEWPGRDCADSRCVILNKCAGCLGWVSATLAKSGRNVVRPLPSFTS